MVTAKARPITDGWSRVDGEPTLRRYRLTARVGDQILIAQEVVSTLQLRYGIRFTRLVRESVRAKLQRAILDPGGS